MIKMPPCAAFFMPGNNVCFLMIHKYRFNYFFCISIIFSVLLLSACEKQPYQFTGKTMGSTYHVTVLDIPKGQSAKNIEHDIELILVDAHARMTTYDEKSELNQFNHFSVNEWKAISPLLYRAIKISREICVSSENAFDPTVFPLVKLWGFGPGEHADRVPDDIEIQKSLANVGCQNIQLEDKNLRIKKLRELQVDLSGIGHGYGADLVAEYLDAKGIKNYLAEVAGEIRSKGHNAKGELWRIAIEKPQDISGEVFQGLRISDIGMATSGDYRNYFMQNGVRYSHTIDPATGRSINHSLTSVTVLDPSAAKADALATAILVMGPEKGRVFAEKMKVPAYFIVHENNQFRGFATEQFMPFMINE
jgi:thiamine biosynthesis lipoprotein